MILQEFDELEEICKDGWKELAITGEDCKPKRLKIYRHDCPACDLAYKTINGDYYSSFLPYCHACPVDEWRKKSTPTSYGTCEQVGSPYLEWRASETKKGRKKWAKIVSNMKWSFLSIYKRLNYQPK